MNKIWVFLIIFCFIYGYINGNINEMINSILNVPKISLDLLIKTGGLIIIYNGIFNIAIQSGMIKKISKVFKKLSYFLFPDYSKDNEIHEYICANITANLLGLGIASTPIALKTINMMKDGEVINRNIITIIILNITSFSLFPLTVLSIRESYGSNIGIFIWISLILISLANTIIGLVINRLFQRYNK